MSWIAIFVAAWILVDLCVVVAISRASLRRRAHRAHRVATTGATTGLSRSIGARHTGRVVH